jgi:hypothetical protein
MEHTMTYFNRDRYGTPYPANVAPTPAPSTPTIRIAGELAVFCRGACGDLHCIHYDTVPAICG